MRSARKSAWRELPASPESSYKTLDAVEQEIVGLERRIEPLLELRAKIEAESERIQDELVRFDMLGAVTVPLSQVLESPFLHFAAGNIKTADLAKLQAAAGRNIVLLSGAADGERRNLVAVTSRERAGRTRCAARQHNFVTEDISPLTGGTPATTLDGMRKRLDEIRNDQERISHRTARRSRGRRRSRSRRWSAASALEQALLEAVAELQPHREHLPHQRMAAGGPGRDRVQPASSGNRRASVRPGARGERDGRAAR